MGYGLKKAKSFIKKVKKKGNDVIFTYQSKTERCPCTDNITREYDKKWHIDHPDEQDCEGTGWLSGQTQETIKAFVIPDANYEAVNSETGGVITKENQVIYFPYNTNVVDIVKITYADTDYKITNIKHYNLTNEVVCYKGDLLLMDNDEYSTMPVTDDDYDKNVVSGEEVLEKIADNTDTEAATYYVNPDEDAYI